jgi:uncharacterized protein YggT (Ycf19 family)
MSLIDLILNVAGLLVWLNWRSGATDPFASGMPSTLSGTVRRAQPVRVKRWHHLSALAALLLLRALFYWQVGPAVNWTPRLDLVFVVLSFHGAFFLPALLFSLLSFIRTFLILYFWLLTLAALNRRASGSDPFQKMITVQLGRLARWPWLAQISLPVFSGAVLWLALYPLLVYMEVAGRTQSNGHLAGQCLLVGAAIVFSLKLLLPAFLGVHLIASYVYLGKSPLLEFVELTARNILKPLNRLSLSAGKVNFAPILGILLVFLILDLLPDYVLTYLSRCNLTLWPR